MGERAGKAPWTRRKPNRFQKEKEEEEGLWKGEWLALWKGASRGTRVRRLMG